MLDKKAIGERFFSCYPGMSRAEVGEIYCDSREFVTHWATKGTIPWSRLKYLSDSKAISWDWLLEGIEPVSSEKQPKTPRSKKPKFPRSAINRRFLTLFKDLNQTEIANKLDVSSATVSDWKHNKRRVGWDRLEDAVHAFGVRWDWLIDGIGLQYREE